MKIDCDRLEWKASTTILVSTLAGESCRDRVVGARAYILHPFAVPNDRARVC